MFFRFRYSLFLLINCKISGAVAKISAKPFAGCIRYIKKSIKIEFIYFFLTIQPIEKKYK